MSDTKKIIKEVLDDWSESQFNIASEYGRDALAEEVSKKIDNHIHQLIEDIVCSQMPRDTRPGEANDQDYQIYNQTN
tara:strand:- start:52 stop:282 length:231 start_codon:yes stop_codon:yes gene_type:complete